MKAILDNIWKIVDTDDLFNGIECEENTINKNKILDRKLDTKILDYLPYLIDASISANFIYDENYNKLVEDGAYCHCISEQEPNKIRYDLITKNSADNKLNAILIIRGTCNKKNWLLNIRAGKNIYLLIALKSFFIFLFIILWSNFFWFLNNKSSSNISILIIFKNAVLFPGFLAVLFILIISYCLRDKLKEHLGDHVLHEGYSNEALSYIENYKLRNYERILIIGHSLGGGVGEEIIHSLNRKDNVKAKGFFFNKAASRIYNSNFYKKHSLDLRMEDDALWLATSIFLQILELPISKHLKNNERWFNKKLVWLYIFLIIPFLVLDIIFSFQASIPHNTFLKILAIIIFFTFVFILIILKIQKEIILRGHGVQKMVYRLSQLANYQ